MALYDYQPGQTSHTTPGQQLELLAGDIVVTYGPVKPDGFYQAKVGVILHGFINIKCKPSPRKKKTKTLKDIDFSPWICRKIFPNKKNTQSNAVLQCSN